MGKVGENRLRPRQRLRQSTNCHIRKGEIAMKISEDWLSVIIAFGLMILALIGIIGPSWMQF